MEEDIYIQKLQKQNKEFKEKLDALIKLWKRNAKGNFRGQPDYCDGYIAAADTIVEDLEYLRDNLS